MSQATNILSFPEPESHRIRHAGRKRSKRDQQRVDLADDLAELARHAASVARELKARAETMQRLLMR